MKIKYLALALSMALVGCKDSGDPVINPTPVEPPKPNPIPSFNLVEIENYGMDKLEFIWDGSPKGITYTVCSKKLGEEDNCLAKASVKGENRLTVTIENIEEEIKQPYFIKAVRGTEKTLSSERFAEAPIPPVTPDPIPSFNLISVVGEKDKTLTFTWDGNPDGITYTACEKNTANVDACAPLLNVVGVSTLSLPISKTIFDEVGKTYFVKATRGTQKQLSQEVTLTNGVIDELSTYSKAPIIEQDDKYGEKLALSADGRTLVILASGEDSAAAGVNVSESDNTLQNSGAAFVLINQDGIWTKQAFLKASNPQADAAFGGFTKYGASGVEKLPKGVAISDDGNTIAIVAENECSVSDAINGDNTAALCQRVGDGFKGGVYVFKRVGDTWTEEARLKASVENESAERLSNGFTSLDMSGDGNTIVVSARGVDADSSVSYVFSRSDATWTLADTLVIADGEVMTPVAINHAGTEFSRVDSSNVITAFKLKSGLWAKESTFTLTPSPDNCSIEIEPTLTYSKDLNQLIATTQCKDVIILGWKGSNLEVKSSFVSDSHVTSLAVSDDGSKIILGQPNESLGTAFKVGKATLMEIKDGAWTKVWDATPQNIDGNVNFANAVDLNGLADAFVVGNSAASTGTNDDTPDESAPNSGAVHIY